MRCKITTRKKKFNTPDLKEEQKLNLIKDDILDSYKNSKKEDCIRGRHGYDPRHDSSDIFIGNILECKQCHP